MTTLTGLIIIVTIIDLFIQLVVHPASYPQQPEPPDGRPSSPPTRESLSCCSHRRRSYSCPRGCCCCCRAKAMDKDKAADFLRSLLNKNLRVTTTDGRLFWGQFRCTDPDRNIVLSHTYEYREPSLAQRREAAAASASASAGRDPVDKASLTMTSRFLGLVVVPGRDILRMEVEEFASQMRSVGGSDEGQ